MNKNSKSILQAKQEILNLVQKDKNKNYLIGISGIDCSGKSTTIKSFYDYLTENHLNVCCLSGDDFIIKKEIRYANKDQLQGYYNESFDYELMFNEVVIPAMNSSHFIKNVNLLNWPNNDYAIKSFEFKAPFVLLLEGVFLFKEKYINHFDYSVWLNMPFDDGLELAFKRTRDIEYYGNENVILEKYTKRFYPTQLYHMLIDSPHKNSNACIELSKDDYVKK